MVLPIAQEYGPELEEKFVKKNNRPDLPIFQKASTFANPKEARFKRSSRSHF